MAMQNLVWMRRGNGLGQKIEIQYSKLKRNYKSQAPNPLQSRVSAWLPTSGALALELVLSFEF